MFRIVLGSTTTELHIWIYYSVSGYM